MPKALIIDDTAAADHIHKRRARTFCTDWEECMNKVEAIIGPEKLAPGAWAATR